MKIVNPVLFSFLSRTGGAGEGNERARHELGLAKITILPFEVDAGPGPGTVGAIQLKSGIFILFCRGATCWHVVAEPALPSRGNVLQGLFDSGMLDEDVSQVVFKGIRFRSCDVLSQDCLNFLATLFRRLFSSAEVVPPHLTLQDVQQVRPSGFGLD